MAAILPGYEYDIFISYRQNDNKYDGWVTEFVNDLQKELEATLKTPVSVYFDENPHDGLQDTHVVDESLKKKLKCLIFIPILSQTYCDESSFAWQHEFLAFNEMANADELGMNITLVNGNVASRILPIRIHDIDADDQQLFESITGSALRAIDFVYKEAGVNRSLKPEDDKKDNLEQTSYRNQMNKVAHAIKDIGTSILKQSKGVDVPTTPVEKHKTSSTNQVKNYLFIGFMTILLLLLGYWGYTRIFNSSKAIYSEKKSIAVLPFTNMSSDKEQDYFCDGIAEDILNDLVQIEDLRVAARTSSFAYKDQGIDIREIGDKLGVSTVLEGSVQKSGTTLRVTAQLINVADGYHLWSKRYDREIEDVFVIKDEIAQNIVKALAIKLTSKDVQKLEKVKTDNVEAHDYYLRGRDYFNRFHADEVLLSIPFYKKAIAIDSSYALAYSGLANSYTFSFMFIDNHPENLQRALSTSKKALELDPELAEAHASRGTALSQNDQLEEAEYEFNEAIKLNPRLYDAYYQYGRALKSKGMHTKATKQFKVASEIEPDNYLPIMFLASCYQDLSLTDKMLEANQQTLRVIKRHVDLNPDDARAFYMGALALITDGQLEEAVVWAEKAVALDPTEIGVLYNVTCIYSRLGKTEEALNYFNQAVESGFGSKEWVENDSDLDNIRNDPRFQAIVDKID
ncbi:MAG: tetratricopeptide repeat protein [Bacteroidota bacterium]